MGALGHGARFDIRATANRTKAEAFSITRGSDRVPAMTPEEELKKLDHLIHQYESVYRTTKSSEQKERVERQLKELRSNRQMILDVNVINIEAMRQKDALAEFGHLRRLLDAESRRSVGERLEPLDADPTLAQEEIFNLMLYVRFFQSEFLPFLTEKRLKLDYKFSLERSGFYGKFKELERKLNNFREESIRLSSNSAGRKNEPEVRKRSEKLKRQIKSDAATLFRAVEGFSQELIDDVQGDGVKCLNGKEEIAFENIEGKHLLEGMRVREALSVLMGLAAEVVAYLKVPEDNM